MSSRHDRLEILDRYLRIPTISRQVTPEMIEAVRGLWRGLGLELTPLAAADGRGTPALYGELPGPEGAPTLLLYGHYDVQPTGDVTRWKWQGVQCEPFTPAYFLEGRAVEPRLIGDEALEDLVLVARGGADNKGQHLSNILGAMDAVRAGTACWKVKIILDGEEEHGSPNLEAIAREHRSKLAADVLIGSDGPKQQNAPTLAMGVRGLLTVNIVADNGQPASVHSGNYGNIVPNPVLPLARLIAHIEAGGRGPSEADRGRHLPGRGRRPARQLHLARAPGVRLASTLAGRARRGGTGRAADPRRDVAAARILRRPGHPVPVDPGGQQQQPAARHQRALRAEALLPSDRALRRDRVVAPDVAGPLSTPSTPRPRRRPRSRGSARARTGRA